MRPVPTVSYRPEVRTLDSAERFAAFWATRYSHLRSLFSLIFDVDGALRARQLGLAVESSRTAAGAALDLKILSIMGPEPGVQPLTPGSGQRDGISVQTERWQAAARIWGPSSDLVTEFWAIDTDVPSSDAHSGECEEYVRRCEGLVLAHAGFRLNASRENLEALLAAFYQAAQVLGALGYAGREGLQVFGAEGYKRAMDIDPFAYVKEHLDALDQSLRAAHKSP